LPDSGYLQEEEALFANKHGFSKHRPALPLYTKSDAEHSLKQFEPIEWNQAYQISDDFCFKFVRAGHLLGAASIRTEYKKISVLFSGDVGRPDDPLMYAPAAIEPADFLVVESTYGDRLHDSRDPKDQLRDILKKTVERRGSLIIPSFAVGRAQLMLYYLHQLRLEKSIPPTAIFLNSPMAQSANRIFESYHSDHRLSCLESQKICDEAIYVNSVEESRRLNHRQEPAIIIAASGMATGGRVLHHLKHYVSDPRNTILFVGFQAGGTRGEAMIHGAESIKIHGEFWPVRAEVLQMDNLSAHADQREMLDWLKTCARATKKIFLTHGELAALDSFRRKIEEDLHWSCHIPFYLEKQALCSI
jgi:metallo-beta-lactamase family protein